LADIEDKLVEKREKLAYFIITASAALTAFTFNNLNSPDDVLRKAPLWVLLVGWALLLLAAAVSLLIIRKRHTTYAEVIEESRGQAERPSEESVIAYRRSMRRFEAVTMALFFAGFVVLAVAHVIALTRTDV
jgi:TRAP-type C4-dicarboxylate transport system permease small subunit